MKLRLLALLACAAPSVAAATQIDCSDPTNAHPWIARVTIDTLTRAVVVEQDGGARKQTSLVYGDEYKENGYRAYAFNVPMDRPKYVNAIKLFFAMKQWRVIDAGLAEVDGKQTLVALGNPARLSCEVRGK